ncbi:hypothetical protein VCRA2114E365_10074 [Vibrio crassostreae]|nr:hypothetical protein VCRA2115O371_10074 [Vibrio crassostreae]CAK1838011.1 hypothetical protein VCRA2113O199_10074 [Vibrio crassostreae]CAK1840685.1 hypothetical protein VCRA2113O362_10074 [Vibrio crassostreae]CAK1842190.1 hypothetical protein VCRA2113O354_10074 [Vibrio crassostreae]CAK1885204.1 hypothetical protein VCRA2114O367_10429 [Vibrio crassostreae]
MAYRQWQILLLRKTSIQYHSFVGEDCKFVNLNCLYSRLCTGSHLLFEALAKVNNEMCLIPITLLNLRGFYAR